MEVVSDRAAGINTRNADAWVAAITASEEVNGHERLLQNITVTAGKVSEQLGATTRSVFSNDTLDITTITGSVSIGDDGYFGCYIRHSQSNGSCLVTPLLCDNNGVVMGSLDSKKSYVSLPVASGTNYISNCLVWDIKNTGTWKVFPHIYSLSDSNAIDMWCYTY